MICGFCFDAEVHVAFLWRIRMKPLEWSSWNMNHIASSTYFASTRRECTYKSKQFLLFTILVSLVRELLGSKKTLNALWVCDRSSTPAKLHFVCSLKGESYWNQAKKFISYMKTHNDTWLSKAISWTRTNALESMNLLWHRAISSKVWVWVTLKSSFVVIKITYLQQKLQNFGWCVEIARNQE